MQPVSKVELPTSPGGRADIPAFLPSVYHTFLSLTGRKQSLSAYRINEETCGSGLNFSKIIEICREHRAGKRPQGEGFEKSLEG